MTKTGANVGQKGSSKLTLMFCEHENTQLIAYKSFLDDLIVTQCVGVCVPLSRWLKNKTKTKITERLETLGAVLLLLLTF